MVVVSSLVTVTYTSDFTPALSNEFRDNQAIMEIELTLNHVLHMIKTYTQIPIISPVLPKGGMFVSEQVVMGLSQVTVSKTLDFAAASSMEFPDI